MKAIIVEDNPSAQNVLEVFLKEYPKGVEVCGVAQTVKGAIRLISDCDPDLWLLDIRLHEKLVFALFREIDKSTVDAACIVFLTAYYEPDYIHEALKVSAIDFIVKPIDRKQLYEVLDKAFEKKRERDVLGRIGHLEETIKQLDPRSARNRIPVCRVSGEIDYIDKRSIVYLTCESQITRVLLESSQSLSTTRTLKTYEELLKLDHSFLRVSKQTIINLDHLQSFNPRTNEALLRDGYVIVVSRRKSAELTKRLSGSSERF